MTELTLFMAVFSLQIILLSAYFPARILARANHIKQHYPASTHPRLYPRSIDFYSRTMRIYASVNFINFVLGWLILYFIYTGKLIAEHGVNPLIPWAYFMLQMIPSQLLEFYGLRLAKLMKQEDNRTIKSAQLNPRRLFDYISRSLLVVVALSFFGFVLLGLYLEDFKLSTDSKTLIMSGTLTLGLIFFVALSKWLIRGKTKDPYQSAEARHKSVKLIIQTFCYIWVACCIFMAMSLVISMHDMKSVMPIMMSLFLQMLVVISTGFMLTRCRIEDIDFDVYKAN